MRTSTSIARAALVLSLLGLAGAALGEDWPTYQHDNQRSGITAEPLAPPLRRQWEYQPPFPPAAGWDPPVNGYFVLKNASMVSDDDSFRVTAAGDAAYFASSAENLVYAVEAVTGKVRWTFATNAPPRYAPAVANGKVYFGSDDGVAWCLNAADGSVVWSVNAAPTGLRMLGQGRLISVWPIRTGVLVENGVAYFAAGLFPTEGVYLRAVNAETGKPLWTKAVDQGGKGGPSPQGYLLTGNDSLWVTSRVSPSRFDLRDGSAREFYTPLPSFRYAAYRWYDGGSYALLWNEHMVYGSGCLLCFDPNKEVIDRYKRKHNGDLVFDWFLGRRVLFQGETAYIATDYHMMAVPHAKLPEMAKSEGNTFRDLYVRCGVANYVENEQNLAQAKPDSPEAATYKQRRERGAKNYQEFQAKARDIWSAVAAKSRWMVPIQATEAMILAGETIYAGGEDRVLAVDARTGKELWSDATGSRVRGLGVANGRLYVSTIDGKVACYAAGPAPAGTVRQVRALAPVKPDAADPLTSFCASAAEVIVKQSGATNGYGLILGGDARLARELAKRTDLHLYMLEPDAGKVASARAALIAAGLHGGRVCVEQAELAPLPFPPYVFNLVIDAESFLGGTPTAPAEEVLRVTRPIGGVAFVGQPPGGAALGKALDPSVLGGLKALEARGAAVELAGAWAKITRGRVAGSQDWTYQFGTPANTYCNEDQAVKGPFGVLWFGSPGPRKTIDRHSSGPPPLVVGGVMYVAGRDLLMAYDAYNGTALWERSFPDSTRGRLPIQSSNLAAEGEGLYFVERDRQCLRLDPRTGRTVRTFTPPAKAGGPEPRWGWLAAAEGRLYGSRAELTETGRTAHTSDAVFAIDPGAGELKWTYEGKGIEGSGIAIGDGTLYLLDRAVTEAQRRQGIAEAVKVTSMPDRAGAASRPSRPVEREVRLLVALDAATGARKWAKPVDVTDCVIDDRVLAFAVNVICMYKDKTLLVASCPANWHGAANFDTSELARRSIYAYDAATGQFLWGGRRYFWKRPVVIGQTVLAEPHAYDLRTGAPKTFANPFTGEPEVWSLHRGYSGCGALLASGACIFGNGLGGFSHYNLQDDVGITAFSNMSYACNINSVPGDGVFVSPEGRSGCACATPIYTSIVLYPRQDAGEWAIYTPDPIATTPVKRLAVNLGAPGARRDAQGRFWLSYPMRTPSRSLAKWAPFLGDFDKQFYQYHENVLRVRGTDVPWVFASGCRGPQELGFRLLDAGQPSAKYTVRLYFAEPDDLPAGQRVFGVSLQGREALKDFDIVREAGAPRTALVKEFRGILVQDVLKISLTAKTGEPILCGLEAVREP